MDVAVYDKSVLTPDKITSKYADVPAKLVIEVDVNVEMAESSGNLFETFVLPKIRNLHQFGTEKVIWIFTQSKTVIIANPDDNWQVVEWDKDVELMNGVKFNIAKYLKSEGIDIS